MAYWWEVVSLLTTTCVTAVTLVANGIPTDVEAVSNEFNTQITPASYAFAIWGVIYTWQVLWLGYAWSLVLRPNDVRTISAGVYWAYALANCCNILWIQVWTSKRMEAALAVFVLLNIFLYAAIGLLWVQFDWTKKAVSRRDYWLTWALPVNGLFCYTTWTTLAVFINLATVLQYFEGFGATDSGTVSLVLLTITILAYMVLENTVFRRFTRYVFTVYPVLIWALIGILVAHWSADSRNAIYVLVLLLAVIAYIAIKAISSVQRQPAAKPHDS